MLIYLKTFLSAMLEPADAAYATIIYPTKDVAVVVHDDLRIAQERPWYCLPVTQQEEARNEPFDIQVVDEELAGRLALLDSSDGEYEFFDDLDDLRASSIGTGIGMLDSLAELVSPFDFDNSASNFSLFGSDSNTDTGGFLDINPANGLPMMDSCFDMCGNPYGTS